MQQNSWQVLSETSVCSALHCFRQCFSSWATADAELSPAASPGGGPNVLQARASWGSMWSHPCGVTGWAEHGQTPGSVPFSLCCIQTQHSWHDGLLTPTCSFSLTCPPGLCSSSSCCMGMKCFFCYTNIQHCKVRVSPFLPYASILVPLFFRDDVSSPRDIQLNMWFIVISFSCLLTK